MAKSSLTVARVMRELEQALSSLEARKMWAHILPGVHVSAPATPALGHGLTIAEPGPVR